MTEEYLDILDERGEKIGQQRSYIDAHKEGLIHKIAHVWILNSKKELLIQKRSHDRSAHPDYWDISVAGHVSAGQTSLEAAQRETEEELGLVFPLEAFKYLFTTEEHIVLNQGTYINNEFQDVFLVRSDVTSSDIKLSDGEVAEVKWVSVEEFNTWIGKEEYKLVPHDEEHRRLLAHISEI